MQRAGWDPRGMAEFMEILRREQGRDPGSVEVFLSSHPAPAERAAVLRAARRAAPRRTPRQRRVPRRQGARPAVAAGAEVGAVVRCQRSVTRARRGESRSTHHTLTRKTMRLQRRARERHAARWPLAAIGRSREEARQGGPKTLPAPIRQVDEASRLLQRNAGAVCCLSIEQRECQRVGARGSRVRRGRGSDS